MEKPSDFAVQSWITTVVRMKLIYPSICAHMDCSVESNYVLPFDNHLLLLLGSALRGSNHFTKQGAYD
jgi:hypothetical protein